VSARLHLCGPDALERLLPMVAAFHAEARIDADDPHRRAALGPLLDGSPYGAVYLVGPERAPVGYLVVTFTWSIEEGGLEAILDEIWIRPAVRGRGMAREAVEALVAALKPTGVRAISLEAAPEGRAARLYARLGFAARDRFVLMSRTVG
jgi:ribosomal protein S18 acetylase RimI-like enzyme